MKISLTGAWKFKDTSHREWMNATVPGSNYLDLMRAGEIPDPFDGMNEKKVAWVYDKDWEYAREFELPEEAFNKEHIYLHADMLDTLADVYVNDRLIGKANNCHLAYDFDIKNFVKEGVNKIRIYFYSPVEYIEEKQKEDAMPRNNMGITGVPHIRKPQCHFGWDWGPILPCSGITRDIYVHAYDDVKILNLRVLQHFNDDMSAVDVEMIPTLSGESINGTFSITAPDGNTLSLGGIVKSGVSKSFHIDNPELWWTNDISDRETQPLYTVTLSLANHEEKSLLIGMRTITLDRSADEYGSQFRFILNGVPLFMKGGNWIPADSFVTRFTSDKIDYFLKSIKTSNMNMLRVWGGGYYESDEFYNTCDKYGILIWQDFMFACAPYPFYNEEFYANVLKEIEYNVKRLRNHACLALWCGNNEIEAMTPGWMLMKKLIDWTGIFFHERLPEIMKELDGITPFTPGSPNGTAFMEKVGSDNDGDTHMWHVWHGLEPLNYYRKRFTRFCSEFGLESLPDMKTIQGFAKPSDYSLKSDVFMAHQKCPSGNDKMLYYMSTRFRIPKRFEDIVYYTQIIQEECVKDATEHWRRNRGRCNGSLYWQINDCWPVSSWASIDYEGRFKALQYCAKHFNAPITVSVEDTKTSLRFFILNDKKEPFEGRLELSLEDFNGKIYDNYIGDIAVDGVTSTCVYKKDFKTLIKKSKERVLYVSLYDKKGVLVARRTHLFAPEKNLNLPKARFISSVKVENGVAYIKIKSDKYARYVKADIENTKMPLSDNFFDMRPGEERILSVPVENNMSDKEILKALSIVSVADATPKASKARDSLLRFRIRMIPINIANWIYYHFT